MSLFGNDPGLAISLTSGWKYIKGYNPEGFWRVYSRGGIFFGFLMEDFVTILGLILVLEGLPYMAFPGPFKAWIARVLELTESQMRVYGLIAVIAGLFLVYLARHSGWLTG